MNNLYPLLVFLLGICIGSFINVFVDRFLTGKSILKGRSYCDSCKKTLAFYDLIPILSYFFLKGKCRYCKSKISPYLPFVELITGVLYVSVLLFLPNKDLPSIIYHLSLVSFLFVIFLVDLKYGVIPDKILFPAILASLVYLFTIHNSLFIIHFLSSAGAFLFFLFLFLATRGKGIGFGDVKLSFLMGLLLGFPNIVLSLYIAFLTGAIVGLILILWGKRRFFGGKIPFGPFLVLGTFLALFWGNSLIRLVIPF